MRVPDVFYNFVAVLYPTIFEDAQSFTDILDQGLRGVGKDEYEEFRSYVTWAVDGGLTDEELEKAWMTPCPSFTYSPEGLRFFLRAAVDRTLGLERTAG